MFVSVVDWDSILLQEMYGNHPMNLVRVVKNCLATEAHLVQQGVTVSYPPAKSAFCQTLSRVSQFFPLQNYANSVSGVKKSVFKCFKFLKYCFIFVEPYFVLPKTFFYLFMFWTLFRGSKYRMPFWNPATAIIIIIMKLWSKWHLLWCKSYVLCVDRCRRWEKVSMATVSGESCSNLSIYSDAPR